jgi:ribosomal protein L40E
VVVGGDPVDEKVVNMAVICPICGAENPDSAEFCNLCLGSMGFDASNYMAPVPEDQSVYAKKYPSSFSLDTPEKAGDEGTQAPPEASPADVGVYGEKSGYDFELSIPTWSKMEGPAPVSRAAPRKKL